MTQIEKIKAEIEKRIEKYTLAVDDNTIKDDVREHCAWRWAECKNLLSFIESLEQEEPQGLDEAAEEYCNKQPWPNDGLDEIDKKECKDDFKAGAEWMAGQGVSYELPVGHVENHYIEDTPFDLMSIDDKVIVQIRKK